MGDILRFDYQTKKSTGIKCWIKFRYITEGDIDDDSPDEVLLAKIARAEASTAVSAKRGKSRPTTIRDAFALPLPDTITERLPGEKITLISDSSPEPEPLKPSEKKASRTIMMLKEADFSAKKSLLAATRSEIFESRRCTKTWCTNKNRPCFECLEDAHHRMILNTGQWRLLKGSVQFMCHSS